MLFKNRTEAGKLLAKKLIKLKGSNGIILAIPRGGVPVAYEISKELHLPLEIELSKKIGHPINPEFAIGSVTLHGVNIDENLKGVSADYIEQASKKISDTLKKKYELFMGKKTQSELKGKIVILVDDGVATGNTIIAGIEAIKKRKPKKIIVAVPVAPKNTSIELQAICDEFVCLQIPPDFHGVGQFYDDFTQVSNEKVIELLNESNLETILV